MISPLRLRQRVQGSSILGHQRETQGQILVREIESCKALIEKCNQDIINCVKLLDELENEKANIQVELTQPQRPVDKGLIKPARGFIMYGPPGAFFPLSFIHRGIRSRYGKIRNHEQIKHKIRYCHGWSPFGGR